MGDDNFDPCECVWGQEVVMRRLLNMLRQSQSQCTDTECFIEDNNSMQNEGSHYYIFMSMLFAAFLFLNFWRNQNARNQLPEPSKSTSNGNGHNGTPPNPPPTSS